MTDPDANPDLLLARILDRARRLDRDDGSAALTAMRAQALARDVLALHRLLEAGHPWPTRWARRYENIPLPEPEEENR